MPIKSDMTLLIGALALGAGALLLRSQNREGTRQILEHLFPTGGFTASGAQLDILVAAGYPFDSTVYNEATAIARQEVAATCASGEYVYWSEEEGYHCQVETPPEY